MMIILFIFAFCVLSVIAFFYAGEAALVTLWLGIVFALLFEIFEKHNIIKGNIKAFEQRMQTKEKADEKHNL